MDKNEIEIWKTALIGETLGLSMLGKVLYDDPDKSWLDTLIHESLFENVPFGEAQIEVQKGLDLLRLWTDKNAGGLSEDEFDAIRKDHLYLFTGVGKPLAPVWESVYFSEGQLLFQKQTIEVREWYARFGLEAERKGREPDDHIGLELSFTAHLASLALQALETENEQEFASALQAQKNFLKEHLLRWGITWTNIVKEHSATAFYAGIAHLTHGALLEIAELLEIKMPEEAVL